MTLKQELPLNIFATDEDQTVKGTESIELLSGEITPKNKSSVLVSFINNFSPNSSVVDLSEEKASSVVPASDTTITNLASTLADLSTLSHSEHKGSQPETSMTVLQPVTPVSTTNQVQVMDSRSHSLPYLDLPMNSQQISQEDLREIRSAPAQYPSVPSHDFSVCSTPIATTQQQYQANQEDFFQFPVIENLQQQSPVTGHQNMPVTHANTSLQHQIPVSTSASDHSSAGYIPNGENLGMNNSYNAPMQGEIPMRHQQSNSGTAQNNETLNQREMESYGRSVDYNRHVRRQEVSERHTGLPASGKC